MTFYARSLKQHDQQNQKTDIDATWYLSCKPQILLHIFYSSEEKKKLIQESIQDHALHLAVTYRAFFNIQWLPQALPFMNMAFRTGIFANYPSVWICLLLLPVRWRLCVWGKSTTEVTLRSSQEVGSGVLLCPLMGRWPSVVLLRWCLISPLKGCCSTTSIIYTNIMPSFKDHLLVLAYFDDSLEAMGWWPRGDIRTLLFHSHLLLVCGPQWSFPHSPPVTYSLTHWHQHRLVDPASSVHIIAPLGVLTILDQASGGSFKWASYPSQRLSHTSYCRKVSWRNFVFDFF